MVEWNYKLDLMRSKLEHRSARANAQLYYAVFCDVQRIVKQADKALSEELLFREIVELHTYLKKEISRRKTTPERALGLSLLIDWIDIRWDSDMMLAPDWVFQTIDYKIR